MGHLLKRWEREEDAEQKLPGIRRKQFVENKKTVNF